jgi:signal transduction histidine kinase
MPNLTLAVALRVPEWYEPRIAALFSLYFLLSPTHLYSGCRFSPASSSIDGLTYSANRDIVLFIPQVFRAMLLPRLGIAALDCGALFNVASYQGTIVAHKRKRREAAGGPWNRIALTIRTKIVLPYLILTLTVAAIGTYVVTSLVAGSLDERLSNHLLEAGRVVSDNLVRQEMSHIDTARFIAFTRGVAEALEDGQSAELLALAQPAASGLGIDCLILIDAGGEDRLHLLETSGNTLTPVRTGNDASNLWIVQDVLANRDLDATPRRAIGIHPTDARSYYFTALPVRLNDRLAGVVVVGTRLDALAMDFKANALADVILYTDHAQIAANTMAVSDMDSDAAWQAQLALSPEEYGRLLTSTETTFGQNVNIRGRWYRLARAPLGVGNDILGVFGVILPAQFIIQAGAASRNTYALLFSIATAGVIVMGYLIAQHITSPLSSLVATSQAVAEGELSRRTGIRSADEIGVLATTFDAMTGRLQERSRELENLLHVYQQASGRMKAILLSIGDGVILEDLEGKLEPQNPAADRMLAQLSSTDQLTAMLSLLASGREPATHGDDAVWLAEQHRFEAGEQVYTLHSAPVQTDDGQVLGRVLVLRDITAEAQAERLKDAFITHVSHELRTPLTVIKGYSGFMISQTAASLGPFLKFIESIDRSTDDLIAMVEGMIELSELQSRGYVSVRLRPSEIASLVREIAHHWQGHMEAKQLAFRVEVPEHLPLVNGDPRRLNWAIGALVRNAWCYTPDGGTVTLRASAIDHQVTIELLDTGPGIPPEQLDQLFTRFHRAGRAVVDEVRGLGLGLYLTHAIVQAHAGEIRVKSAPGRGSTFSLVLPSLSAASVDSVDAPNGSSDV